MTTIIVWFRNDLRIHDNPALHTAVKDADTVIPLFIMERSLINGSANRTRFLLESLADLKSSLKNCGGDLVVREGEPADVLEELAKSSGAHSVYYAADYSPYSIRRDRSVEAIMSNAGIKVRSFGGRLAINSIVKLQTKAGKPYGVFTPFWRSWQQVTRRDIVPVPHSITLPANVQIGELPKINDITDDSLLSPTVLRGGESAGRARLKSFLDGPINHYDDTHNSMAADATSRLSSYLHFGCLSPREIETMLPESNGAQAWHRQLCWREFYHYVLLHNPHKYQTYQERYRSMKWDTNATYLKAWQDGQTGYPVVDAAMRQLRQEGWMHNRARLIVGSFLTKDLWLSWREGEAYFMQWLIDGDTANNNGNWQWIASVGVDPAPVFRRLYNPSSQQQNYDPEGEYVRRFIPELKDVPLKYLAEPWLMSDSEQIKFNCKIGKDYPAPIVDHKKARQQALARYAETKQ